MKGTGLGNDWESEKIARIDLAQAVSLQDFRQLYHLQHLVVNGINWEYLASGEGDETILFLPGLAGAYDIWWQQITALQDRYRIISVTYPAVSGLREMARGLLAILEQEDVDRATVVGSSLGGYLAQYLLAAHPGRVERAVFGNTYANCELIRQRYRLAGAALPRAPEWLVMAILRASYRLLIYPTSRHMDSVLEYLIELTDGRMSKAQIESRYLNVVEPFLIPDPSTLNTPLLILESDNDPMIEPRVQEDIRRTYPTASVYTFHNAGHFPYLVVPQEYLQVLTIILEGKKREGGRG
ncbi:MAG TPA: alpha/beta hydrolase [Anaerolineales bacterium]|nr:alpha/beta hydrolase [Anaerolineales bacterium]